MPTPLLDWTSSPYIAAYFAFEDALQYAIDRETTHVRIYALSQAYWDRFTGPRVLFNYVSPYTAPLVASARMNPRLYAQHGNFLVTNIADLESFMAAQQRQTSTADLVAVNLPVELLIEALTDLRLMGITATSLFPGIDGICRAIKFDMMLENLKVSKTTAAP
jgi:hypothetical protein